MLSVRRRLQCLPSFYYANMNLCVSWWISVHKYYSSTISLKCQNRTRFPLFLFPFCDLFFSFPSPTRNAESKCVYMCVWVHISICVCACISPMQLQGLGHHAPEIWWTPAIIGKKTCDRYAAKNILISHTPAFPSLSLFFLWALHLNLIS